uniref:EOG090X0J8E n=1 Tax=Lynceus sp. MCZ IZ 141354 TaxID=1930659 RepID=A0A9N6WV30_9CRUS|nr:EOG090X0J8E [Lynceus sp. MCZ IZ 141354]
MIRRPPRSTRSEFYSPTIKSVASTMSSSSLYGVRDTMMHGFGRTKDDVTPAHPLKSVLLQQKKTADELDMNLLCQTQGQHMPIRLHMEKKIASRAGHLPCLHRHQASLDALTGRDMMIDFNDIYNMPNDAEVVGFPHAVIEKHLGLL